MKILIVEDNNLLGESMIQGLSEAGWTVDLAKDGEEGLYMVQNSTYDLLIIDRMLPKLSGIELIKKLRQKIIHVPAIMVTARGDLEDRISGLEEGADDYLVKPVELSELLARVKALHRRSLNRGIGKLCFAALEIDLSSRVATIDNRAMDLTAKEFDFLATVAGKSGHVFNRNELNGLLYKFNDEPESNSLDVLLARIRRKLVGSGVEIATIRGRGVVFRVEEATTKS
ncbi:MAG: response regulator transcription factor [Pseudomonadota bacterium]